MARGEVRYRLALETSAFTSGIKAAKQEAASLGDDLAGKLGKAGQILGALGPMGQGAAIGIGAMATAATAVGAALVSVTKQAAEYADNMAALGTKTGMSAAMLQKLELAAKLGNTSLESMAAAANKVQRGIAAGDDDFKRLGLSIDALRKMSPDAQLRTVAVALGNIKDPAQRASAEFNILGKSGNEVRGGLEALASGAANMKGELSDAAINGAAELADKMDLLDTAFERVKNQIGAAIASSPEVKRAFDDITQAVANIAEEIAKAMPKVVAFVDALVSISRASVKGLAAGGGPMQMVEAYQEEFARSQLRDVQSKMRQELALDAKPLKLGTFDKPNPKDDAAARAAASAAEQARAAWQRAAEKSREQWDKFYDGMKERGIDAIRDMEEGTSKRVKAMAASQAEQIIGRKQAENAMSAAMMEDAKKLDEYEAGYYARADERLIHKINLVGDLGFAFQELGGIVGGVFGAIMNGLGNITNGIGNAMASIRQMKTSGGGIGGILGKASGALGLAGAAFSIGKTIFGGIKSLFGGKSDEEKAAEKQKIADTTAQLGDIQKKLDGMKFDKVVAGISGVAALFRHAANSADLTQERMDRLGILGAAMFQDLKRQGLSTVEAMRQMGPALDEALKAAEKSGLSLGGTLGMLADFQQKVSANEGLVSAAEGLSSVMEALRATGSLTQETFNALQGELGDVFSDLVAKGFTADQALALLAPTLLQIRDAAKEGKIAVDEQTAALIQQAEAGGHFDGIKDPMKEMVELQKMMLQLWASIAQMQGVTLPESLRAYIATLNEASRAAAGVGIPAGGGVAGGGGHYADPGSSGPEGSTQSAGGFWNPSMPHGPLAGGGTNLVVHPGEEVSVTPRGHKGGGMGNVVLNVDGRAFARVQNNNTRKNRGGARSQGQRFIGRQ